MKQEGNDNLPSLREETQTQTLIRTGCLRIWQALRPSLGWLCMAVGALGMIFPLLPGIPFLLVGVALVGRRNWVLRWVSVQEKRVLRRWARHPAPIVRGVGRWLARRQWHVTNRLRRRY
jgi:hypothetical protein